MALSRQHLHLYYISLLTHCSSTPHQGLTWTTVSCFFFFHLYFCSHLGSFIHLKSFSLCPSNFPSSPFLWWNPPLQVLLLDCACGAQEALFVCVWLHHSPISTNPDLLRAVFTSPSGGLWRIVVFTWHVILWQASHQDLTRGIASGFLLSCHLCLTFRDIPWNTGKVMSAVSLEVRLSSGGARGQVLESLGAEGGELT